MPETTGGGVVDTLQKFSIPLAIVIAGALIAGALYFSGKGGAQNIGGAQPTPANVNVKDVKVGPGDPFIGKADAPVTLAYWSDYQCPFCKAVEVGGVEGINIDPSIPNLVREYVDTGKLRIVFKDFAFLGNDSITAALYEHAVWDTYPDKFFAWRTAMFEAQDDEGDQGFGDEASILALIKKIPGMNADTLKALVAQKKDAYTADQQADREEGARFGISGTPGFITGTQLIAGAESLSVFKKAIDDQLK